MKGLLFFKEQHTFKTIYQRAPPYRHLIFTHKYGAGQGGLGGRGFSSRWYLKKMPLPSAVAKYLGFLSGTLWKFRQHMAKPQIFGHIPP